jgi:hypothetical protein
MGFAFNPFTGNFDLKGSGGGGGSAFFAGEVATYADLPLDGTAALDSRWLVRSNSGTWPFSSYKQAGVYVRKAIVGASRDNDYQLTDTSFHDVMSDAAFVIYDDGAPTRSMQVEITDNETLTFKVTGTDSVVRSVAFALSAIVLAALMASSAMAQNIGLVTDTNGNIVTRRTNTLVWSNNLRFTPLTNANSRTAIIGTNGALTAGNPPSAAAANGALLTADGAGGSSFVESRTQFSRIMSATSRSNWTNNDWNFAVNDDTNASLSLAANTTYRVTWNLNIQVATNTLSWGYTLAATATFITNLQRNGTYQFRDGLRAVGWETSSGQSTAVRGDGGGQTLEFRTNMDRIVGGSMVLQTGTNAATLYFRWWPGQNTNQPVSLGTNSWLHAEKLN